ncbi:hypothetical protein [Sphingobium aromaticiconvertens]|uniref:hypothetical protein n=1 Tax=Sphingobium aromaticiconvertens TaxID=365341 RepID=UPI003018C00E
MSDPRFLQDGYDAQLGHFVEECGEVLTAIGKTMRWGLNSVNPLLPRLEQETNRAWMRREMCDLRLAMDRLEATLDTMP